MTQKQSYYLKNKEKMKDSASRRYYALRELFMGWKETLKCTLCGETETVCLDFHHCDPSEKDSNIWRMVANGERRLKEELAKCIVLCANCHRKVHANNTKTDPTIHNLAESFDNFC